MTSTFAQQQTDLTGILLWGGLLILIAVGAFAIMVFAKKRLFREESTGGFTWSHEQLLEMRDSGEITIQQYEKLKSQWFSEIRDATDLPNPSADPNSGKTLTPDAESAPKDKPAGDKG